MAMGPPKHQPDAEPFMRCEFQARVEPTSDLEAVFRELTALDLPNVKWRGWRHETDGCGFESFVAIARLLGEVDLYEDDNLVDCVLDALESSPAVQRATLLSSAANCPDTFALCCHLFSTHVDDLQALQLPTLGTAPARALITHGFAVVDDILPLWVTEGIAALAAQSLAIREAHGTDGVAWRTPEPRDGRNDVATWVTPESRPGLDCDRTTSLRPTYMRRVLARCRNRL